MTDINDTSNSLSFMNLLYSSCFKNTSHPLLVTYSLSSSVSEANKHVSVSKQLHREFYLKQEVMQ